MDIECIKKITYKNAEVIIAHVYSSLTLTKYFIRILENDGWKNYGNKKRLPSVEQFIMWSRVFDKLPSWGDLVFGFYVSTERWLDFYKDFSKQFTPEEKQVYNFLKSQNAFSLTKTGRIKLEKAVSLILINTDFSLEKYPKNIKKERIKETEIHELCHFFCEEEKAFASTVNGIFIRLEKEVKSKIILSMQRKGYDKIIFAEEFAANYLGNPSEKEGGLEIQNKIKKLDLVWREDVNRIKEEFKKLKKKCKQVKFDKNLFIDTI